MTTASPIAISPRHLVSLRRDARRIKQVKGKVRAQQSGHYLSRLRGRGMEFDEVRAYQNGDDVRSIDWRVTARTGKPHTKLYTEEKERPVMLCLDYRHSMHFATRGVFKSVLASHIAALLAWSANLNGDRIGGLLFAEGQHASIKAQRGKHAVLDLFHRMSELHSSSRAADAANADSLPDNLPDSPSATPATLTDKLRYLRRLCRPGSLVYIISDFHGLDDSARQQLIELSRHCELILISVYDPIEAELPRAGVYRFKDAKRDVQIDTRARQQRQQHQQRFAAHQQRLQTLARKHRMRFLACSTADKHSEQLCSQLQEIAI